MKTIDFHCFFFAFLCSGNIPAPGASGDGFGGPGAYFSPIAGRRSGRYLRSKSGIRLQAQLRLAHVPTRSLAFLARFAPVPTRIFVGPYSPLAGAILEGPPAHNPIAGVPISATPALAIQAMTQPPDPTLPSRAHHQDYVSRTTSGNPQTKLPILSAGPGWERPGIEKSTVFNQKPLKNASILSAGPGRERPVIEKSSVFN